MLSDKSPEPKYHYKAVRYTDWGAGHDNSLVTGLTLELLPEDLEDDHYLTDPLGFELSELGAEAPIHLPENGLEEGKIYKLIYHAFKDWETGIVDDYEVHVVEVKE